jgi:hypothetical protein
MNYILATSAVSDQEQSYYAGPIRTIGGRMAHKVTHSRDHATRFGSTEEAEAMCRELGDGYKVVPVER